MNRHLAGPALFLLATIIFGGLLTPVVHQLGHSHDMLHTAEDGVPARSCNDEPGMTAAEETRFIHPCQSCPGLIFYTTSEGAGGKCFKPFSEAHAVEHQFASFSLHGILNSRAPPAFCIS
jgi:hypothetical protein